MQPDNKQIKRIQALLAKTVENGCTEAEAITAANLAATLMQRNNITFAQLGKAERLAKCASQAVSEPFLKTGHEAFLYQAVGKFCDVKTLVTTQRRFNQALKHYRYIGVAEDVQIAKDLIDRLLKIVEQETENYLFRLYGNRPQPRGTKKVARNSFKYGLIERICERLDEIKRANTLQHNDSALIVVKTDLVALFMRDLYGPVRAKTTNIGVRDDNSDYLRGQQVGNNVAIHDRTSNSTQMIAGY